MNRQSLESVIDEILEQAKVPTWSMGWDKELGKPVETNPIKTAKAALLKTVDRYVEELIGENWAPRNGENSRSLGYNEAKDEIRKALRQQVKGGE